VPKPFSKILVARHSPKNKCYADDGVVLFVKPLPSVPPKDHVGHCFLSTSDQTTKSQYGWVAGTEPFDLDDFIRDHLDGRSVNEAERAHLEVMFKAITKLNPETPVAVTYSARGIGSKRMELTVHRVFFHKA
jgi:hypothetical protein